MVTSDLQDELNVSNETLRKDLILLEEEGFLSRSHGSVSLASSVVDDKMDIRQVSAIPEKRRIARAALKYLPDNPSSIILDSGNTVWFLAELIAEYSGYTIVTNSLDTARVLIDGEGDNTIYSTGGIVRHVDYSQYGRFALNCINSMNYSVCFLGTAGVKSSDGIGAVSFDDRDIKQSMLAQSDYCIALIDSSKFENVVLLDSVSWEDIDVVITDDRISESDKNRLMGKTKVVIV